MHYVKQNMLQTTWYSSRFQWDLQNNLNIPLQSPHSYPSLTMLTSLAAGKNRQRMHKWLDLMQCQVWQHQQTAETHRPSHQKPGREKNIPMRLLRTQVCPMGSRKHSHENQTPSAQRESMWDLQHFVCPASQPDRAYCCQTHGFQRWKVLAEDED